MIHSSQDYIHSDTLLSGLPWSYIDVTWGVMSQIKDLPKSFWAAVHTNKLLHRGVGRHNYVTYRRYAIVQCMQCASDITRFHHGRTYIFIVVK